MIKGDFLSSDLSKKLLLELQKLYDPIKITNFEKFEYTSVNTLYKFTKKSENYIVKILTRPPTSEREIYRLEKEVQLFKHFRSLHDTRGIKNNQRKNVPVPKVDYYEGNEEIIGYKYYIMNEIPGESLDKFWNDLTKNQKERFVQNFAEITRSIHSISYEMFGEIEQYDCPRQFYSMESLIKTNTRRCVRYIGRNKLLPIKFVLKIQDYIEKLLEKSNFCSTPGLVHTDLNPSNIIIEKSNDQIKINGILDFEWAYAGDPIFDLFEIENEWLNDFKLQRIFYERYSNGLYSQLENYEAERKIHIAINNLSTVAFGWVYFHPTTENLDFVKNELELVLSNER
ncbi:MAG: aminoglycoside phosphotransferase family protein [Asgard group archaeon]|nr:aminoglycoside phosphotransferase family protein [Asgard group archaeon]